MLLLPPWRLYIMDKILLKVIGLSYNQSQNGSYALILEESGTKRKLPIIIGGFEAQAVAIGLEKMHTPRPMTHDLMKNVFDFFNIELLEVIIHTFKEGVFHALLVCRNNGEISEIDARTSDAIALALRFHCPVYTYPAILDEAGIILDQDDNLKTTSQQDEIEETHFSEYLLTELEEQMKEAIESENYEKASLIRDEINRRKKKI